MSEPTLEIFDPASIEEEAFLLGPESEDGELDVDDIFAKDFGRMVAEMREMETDPYVKGWDEPQGKPTPSDVEPGYSYLEIRDGLILLSPTNCWVGGFISVDAAILTEHQGLGLGAELFLEYAMRNHGLPTWNLDKAAYSQAGEACARSAWRLAHKRDMFNTKKKRLLNQVSLTDLSDKKALPSQHMVKPFSTIY